MKAILIVLLVLAVLVGGLMVLRTSRNLGMPDKDVMDRAKQREREQSAKDDREA